MWYPPFMLLEVEESALRPMSLEAWADLDEDEEGELVDGVLVEEEVPTFVHERIVAFLVALLGAWARPRPILLGGSDGKFAVTAKRGRKPDLFAYLPGSKRPRMNASISHIPPDIVVEVVSARPRDVRRDRVEKLSEYAKFGVKSYWLVDPVARTFEILLLGADGHYSHRVSVLGGRIEEVPLCEGLVIDLDALWTELDQLDAEGGAEE